MTNDFPTDSNASSQTRVRFDLRDVLTDDEIEQFRESAERAGAESITEHFLNLTIRQQP